MQNGEGGARAARSPWDIDISLCGILSFLFTWNWIVSQSPTSLTVEWGAWRIPARAILLVSFAVAGFTLFALRRYRPVAAPKIRRVRSITVAMVLAAGILVPDILDSRFDGELAGAPFAAQMIFMGVASAYLTTVVGTLFGLKGIARPTSVTPASVIGLLLCVPLQIALYYVPGSIREGAMVAFLVSVPFLYGWQVTRDRLRESRRTEKVRIPLRFIATLLIMGIALGTLQGIFTITVAADGHSLMNPLSTLGFLLAALAAGVTMTGNRFDYNHLIYQMGIPILACGFIFAALGGNQFVAFVICLMGYYATFVVLWVLGAYLTAESPSMVKWLFALMGAVMALGQALGLIAVDTQMVGLVREDSILIGTFLLLACLFLVGDRSPYESWGIVHPTHSATLNDLSQACQILAAETHMTNRERDILPLLAQGRNRKVIAETLVLSENTVKTHISNLYAKAGVHTQQELIDLAQQRAEEGSGNR